MSILPKITGISISEGARQIIDLGYDLDNDNAVVPMAELDLFGGGIGMRAYEEGLLAHQFALNTLGVLVQSGIDAPQSVTWSNLANKVEAVGALSTASNATTLNVNNTISIQNGETSLPPTSSIVISCDTDFPNITINDGIVALGQVLTMTSGGINWEDLPPNTTPTLQQVIDTIPSGNTVTGTPIIMTGSIGATLIDATYSADGISILTTVGSYNVAEYSTAGMYLNIPELTDNIVINPSIVLNTTEDGAIDSGISSLYSCNTIGYDNSFEIKHNTAFGLPTLTQTLNENLGSPFNYNKNVQTPTNITLTSSLYADQQTLDLITGLTTTQIQSSGGNLQVVSATDFTEEVNFLFADSPPHCAIVPENPNDLTNKLYVDTKVIASGGGQQMYFNQSVASTPLPYKALGTTIVVAPQQILTTPQLNPFLGVPQVIAQFITEPSYPNITTLPAGIWTANIYGNVTGGTAGTLYYIMKVYTFTTGSVKTLIGTGTGIQDVDATTDIFLYSVSTTIDTIIGLNLTDRIIVEILTNGVNNNPLSNLNTYFQDGTYSFLTTPLISGTNLLGLANSWTGINTFANTTTNIGSLVVSTNALNTTSTATPLLIGDNLTNGSGGALKIGANITTNEIWIGTANSAGGSIRIRDGVGTGGYIYIANGTASATQIQISTATGASGAISIASGVGSGGTVTIGALTRLSNIYGSSSSTYSGGTATLAGTITAFPTAGTNVPTTQWVKNAINYAEKGKITSGSTPALAITGTLTFVQTYTVAPLVLLTVDMGSGTVIVSCALAGVSTTAFNYILSSLTGVSSLNYYVIVI